MGRLPGQAALALAVAALGSALPAGAAGFDHGAASNGFAAATFDTVRGQLDAFYPHPYVAYSAQQSTPELARAAYFGVRAGGQQGWLAGLPVASAGYVAQGTVFRAQQPFQGLTVESYLFTPQGYPGPLAILALHVTNGGGSAVTDDAAFACFDFQVGGGASQAAGETAEYLSASDAFELHGSAATVLFASLSPSEHHARSPTDVVATVAQGNALPDDDGPVTQDGALLGFEWAVPTLAPGADAWLGVAILAVPGDPAAALAALQGFVAGRSVSALVQAEARSDAAYLAGATLPLNLSAAETRVAREQLSILRMAQSREPNAGGATPYGAMMAALPPGEWHLDWVRDSAYAAVALARSGLVQAAEDDLGFVLAAKVGGYEAEVGHPYAISVCRHYGDGEEWSDVNQDGPNIELDGFGLTLWAADEVMRHGGDPAWLTGVQSRLLDGTAGLLPELIDGSGLLTPDSSSWEVHWDGQQRHFTYTDAAAVAGLCGASHLASLVGDARGAGWARAAQGIASAILSKCTDAEGALAGTMEGAAGQGDDRDAAAIEAVNFGAIPAGAPASGQTVRSIEAELAVASGQGFRRDNQGGAYDASEWAFVDLRLAAAIFGVSAAPTVSAETLLDRVTNAADQAYGLVPELYDPATGAYAGAVPMVGFGAGAYLLALWARSDGPLPVSCAVPPGGSAGAPLDGKPPPCCAAVAGDAGWLGLALALGLLLRRRV